MGEQGSSNEKEARVKVSTIGSHGRERDQQKEGIVRNQFAREIISQWSAAIQTTILTEWFYVTIKRIAGRKEGSSKLLMRAPTN
jgi:hypothetical protein